MCNLKCKCIYACMYVCMFDTKAGSIFMNYYVKIPLGTNSPWVCKISNTQNNNDYNK